jgi:signal transduction histidine kinase
MLTRRRGWLARVRGIGVALLLAVAPIAAPIAVPIAAQEGRPAAPPDRRVLLLDVGDPDRPAFRSFNDAFLARLRADAGQRVIVFREHHDPRLGIDSVTLRRQVETWDGRFASVSIDAIVATGPLELTLALELRSRWRRQVPIIHRVSAPIPAPVRDRLERLPAVAGVISPSPLPAMVQEIRRLRPALRHLVVVAGGPGDLAMLENEAGPQLIPSITIHPWVTPSLPALRDSLRRLPDDAAVLYVSVFTDGDGRSWTPADFLAAFADASAQPVFGLYRNLVGLGIVGGPVVDPARQGRALAERALAVLRDPTGGERFPLDTIAGWQPVYDWVQLRRHRIPLRMLGDDARIEGRPIPIWESDPFAFWVVTVLLVLQAISIVALVASRRLVRRSEVGLSALTRRLQTAQDEEQARLSRELHDTLGQDLVSQALDLERHAPATAAPGQPTFAARLRQSVVRLEGIARELHPGALSMLDLPSSLERLAADLRARTGIDVTLSVEPVAPPLPSAAQAAIFRVVQEALTNIRRHAQASHAAIFLQCRGATVEVLVRDDGAGFDPVGRVDARLGLLGMRERAAAIGGRLEIQSSAAEGTTITLIIPQPLTA